MHVPGDDAAQHPHVGALCTTNIQRQSKGHVTGTGNCVVHLQEPVVEVALILLRDGRGPRTALPWALRVALVLVYGVLLVVACSCTC